MNAFVRLIVRLCLCADKKVSSPNSRFCFVCLCMCIYVCMSVCMSLLISPATHVQSKVPNCTHEFRQGGMSRGEESRKGRKEGGEKRGGEREGETGSGFSTGIPRGRGRKEWEERRAQKKASRTKGDEMERGWKEKGETQINTLTNTRSKMHVPTTPLVKCASRPMQTQRHRHCAFFFFSNCRFGSSMAYNIP